MTFNHCREEELVTLYYRDLETAERQRLERHLEGCAACRNDFSDLCRFLEEIPRFDPDLSSVDMDRFVARIVSKTQKPEKPRIPAWSMPLAAAAVLVGIMVARWPDPLPTAPSTEVATELEVLDNLEFLQELHLLENLELLLELEGSG